MLMLSLRDCRLRHNLDLPARRGLLVISIQNNIQQPGQSNSGLGERGSDTNSWTLILKLPVACRPRSLPEQTDYVIDQLELLRQCSQSEMGQSLS